MRRYLHLLLLTAALAAMLIAPAGALEFTLDAPEDYLFGRPTSTDMAYTQENQNVDRSKNTALIAPGFGTPTVALRGHNRGVNTYFGQIHTLKQGVTITLTTKLGTRSYAVTSAEKVSETDASGLAAAANNQITLYTCVRDQGAYRWCVKGGRNLKKKQKTSQKHLVNISISGVVSLE